MGEPPQAVPNRLARGEQTDVILMVGSALENLVTSGVADKTSRIDPESL